MLTPEELTQTKEEARVLALAAPVLLPGLRKKEQVIINRLIGEYRTGATNLTGHIAELAAVRDWIRDIENKAKQHQGG